MIRLVTVPVHDDTQRHLTCLAHEGSALPTQRALPAPLCGFFGARCPLNDGNRDVRTALRGWLCGHSTELGGQLLLEGLVRHRLLLPSATQLLVEQVAVCYGNVNEMMQHGHIPLSTLSPRGIGANQLV